jgi:hypothetical protein
LGRESWGLRFSPLYMCNEISHAHIQRAMKSYRLATNDSESEPPNDKQRMAKENYGP